MEIHSYGIAQICLNGHVITDKSDDAEIKHKFCYECGELIINKCEVCEQNIKGRPRYEDHIDPPFEYF